MKRIEIKVAEVGKAAGELGGSVQVMIESLRDSGDWSRDQVIDAPAGAPEVNQSFVLRENQRLVISSTVAVEELRYDRTQGAAIRPSTQESSTGADVAKQEFSTEEKKRFEQADQNARAQKVLNDPIAMEKEGIAKSDQPVGLQDAAKTDAAQKLKREAEEKEKAASGETGPKASEQKAKENAQTTTPQQLTRVGSSPSNSIGGSQTQSSSPQTGSGTGGPETARVGSKADALSPPSGKNEGQIKK
jgi:hypothetical protein